MTDHLSGICLLFDVLYLLRVFAFCRILYFGSCGQSLRCLAFSIYGISQREEN